MPVTKEFPLSTDTAASSAPSQRKPLWKLLAGSYVCLAFLILILLDFTARLTFANWSLDKYNSPNRSWIWWNTKDFLDHADNPDVLLLGSSLMMAALHGGDATFLNTPQNVAIHHRSAYLEKLLNARMHKPVSTFAFALGGQMASDAYAIAASLFHDKKKPRTIIYGIAPRDFLDNTIPSPASSETYRYLERTNNKLSNIALSSRTSFWDQCEWLCGRISFLYGIRPDLVYLQNKYARQLLAHVFNLKDLQYVHTPIPLRRLALLELPEDQGPNDLTVSSYYSQPPIYLDNIAEYRKRYQTFKEKTFRTQLMFLEKLLDFCRTENINIVVVNMPLTDDNVHLMPPAMYSLYLKNVKSLTAKSGAAFIDMQNSQLFPKRMFADSVHLNGLGGQQFFEVLSERMQSIPKAL